MQATSLTPARNATSIANSATSSLQANQFISIEKGGFIYHEGDDIDVLYKVVNGAVLLKKFTEDGRCQVLDIIGPGDFVDLSTEGQYDHSAEASVETLFERLEVAKTPLTDAQTKELLNQAHRRIRKDRGHLLMLGRLTAEERLAGFFMNFAKAATQGAQPTISLGLSRQQIADFVGLTLETVSRILSKWRKAGVIDEKRGHSLCLAQPTFFQEFVVN